MALCDMLEQTIRNKETEYSGECGVEQHVSLPNIYDSRGLLTPGEIPALSLIHPVGGARDTIKTVRPLRCHEWSALVENLFLDGHVGQGSCAYFELLACC